MADVLPLDVPAAVMTSEATATAPQPLAVGRVELARLLGIGPATLDRLRAAGKLPAPARLGGRIVWPVEEVRAWLTHRTPGGGLTTAHQWAAVRAAVLARG